MKYDRLIRILLIFSLLLLFGGCSKELFLSPTYANNITTLQQTSFLSVLALESSTVIDQISKVTIKESKSNNLNEEYINKIWDTVYADVNGDGDKEKIELVGKKGENSLNFCMGNLKLNIRNSKSNEIIKTQLVFENQGVYPKLVISDLNNDGAQDMLISMNSGGNGYGHIYYALYTLNNNELKQIDLESIRDEDTHIEFELYDEDQLLLKFDGLKDNFIVPLSRYQAVLYKKIRNKEKFYDDREDFGYFPASNFKIVDYDGDGKNELKCSKLFAAEYKSEIAWLEVIYKYNNTDWKVISAKIEPIYKRKSESDKAKQININDLKFGKLMCGLNYNEVIEILGKPLKEKKFVGLSLGYEDGTRLYICPVVNHIEINSSNYSTPRGLVVGDSKEKVIELYGKSDEVTKDSTSEWWNYWTDDLDYLRINFEEKKVKSITVDCANSLRK